MLSRPNVLGVTLRALLPLLAMLLLPLCLLLPISKAHALGADIGDFAAPVPGHDLMALYMINSKNSDMYKNSQIIDNRAKLDVTTTILRYAHPTLLGDSFIINPSVVLTHQNMSPDNVAGLDHTAGMGDPFIGAPFWLLVDRENREYLTIGPWLYLPLGEYDHKDFLNPGENRWKAVLQLGYQRGLGQHFDLDVLLEADFYGKNDEYGPSKLTRRQRPWYEAKGGVTYLFNDRGGSQLGVGLYFDHGGETEIDGQLQGDQVKTRGFYIQGSTMLTPVDQFMVGLFRDLDVENGFKMSQQLRLRYLHVF
ncbi:MULTISPECIES: transporter [Pseudomonas]|uniref:transporter n=1 Tax=Pseudomonas TaxID=286 RepID=UPI0010C140F0|nr:transporter [Pseudomonas asiatica]EKT4467895.1 transporter [Pseudomonas putida]